MSTLIDVENFACLGDKWFWWHQPDSQWLPQYPLNCNGCDAISKIKMNIHDPRTCRDECKYRIDESLLCPLEMGCVLGFVPHSQGYPRNCILLKKGDSCALRTKYLWVKDTLILNLICDGIYGGRCDVSEHRAHPSTNRFAPKWASTPKPCTSLPPIGKLVMWMSNRSSNILEWS